MRLSKLFHHALSFSLALLLIFSLTFTLTVTANAATVYQGASWMASVPDDTPLDQITLPATHDSGTFNIRYGQDHRSVLSSLRYIKQSATQTTDFGALIPSFLSPVVEYYQRQAGQCQTLSIQEQLDAGVRWLDLRYRYESGSFTVCHGNFTDDLMVCKCYEEDGLHRLTLKSIFQTMSDFIAAHPTEVLMFTLGNEGGEEGEYVDKALAALKASFPVIQSGDYLDTETLGSLRGNIYDISNLKHDNWHSFSGSMAYKFYNTVTEMNCGQNPKDAISKFAMNIPAKFYKFADEYSECSLALKVVSVHLGLVKLPLFVTVDMDKLLKTPTAFAAHMNTIIDYLPEACNGGSVKLPAPDGDTVTLSLPKGRVLGFVRMDFATVERCFNIVQVNNSALGCDFVYSE